MEEKYKKILHFLLIMVNGISLILGSWPIWHNDLYFASDIARDFLLFNEIQEKFVILIGPRSSGMPGLFHGVLWLYLNFPAYFLGNGNPVYVGWFWIFLVIAFGFIYYFLFKNIFSKTATLVFVTVFISMISLYVKQFYNPIGALLIMPLVYYFMYQYLSAPKIRDGIILFLLIGAVIQFQMAAGIPVLILVLLPFLYRVIRLKKFKHLLIPLVIIIPLSSFLLFELSHDFVQTKVVLQSFTHDTRFYTPYDNRIPDRLRTIKEQGIGFFNHEPVEHYNKYVGIVLALMVFHYVWKDRDLKRGLLIYLYVGFYALSILHNGMLLIHYILPLMLIPMLFFTTSYKRIPSPLYWTLIGIILGVNIYSLKQRAEIYESNKYRWEYWNGLNTAFNVIKDTHTQDKVGVFIYAPDIYAYGPKYAFLYNKKHTDSFEYIYHKKEAETYLLYEPAPPGQSEFDGADWRTRQVDIDKKPVKSVTLPNGYRVEKYILSEEEQNIPHDTTIDDWVSQR